jgi:peptidylprolyl isomerase
MPQAKQGDTVQVHYKGTLDDGTMFDSSEGREPLEVQVGAGHVIPGFDEALLGMSVGDKKTAVLPVDQAYGPRRDELVFQVERAQLAPGTEVSLGDHLRIGFPDGRSANVQITAMDEETLTLDANHPLAGQNLTFELELVGIA